MICWRFQQSLDVLEDVLGAIDCLDVLTLLWMIQFAGSSARLIFFCSNDASTGDISGTALQREFRTVVVGLNSPVTQTKDVIASVGGTLQWMEHGLRIPRNGVVPCQLLLECLRGVGFASACPGARARTRDCQ